MLLDEDEPLRKHAAILFPAPSRQAAMQLALEIQDGWLHSRAVSERTHIFVATEHEPPWIVIWGLTTELTPPYIDDSGEEIQDDWVTREYVQSGHVLTTWSHEDPLDSISRIDPWKEVIALVRAHPDRIVTAPRRSSTIGVTLTFDTRLHRFDPAAFELLIAQVLGPDTDVTIEERSPLDTDGPSFIRINGSQAEDLVRLTEAFYDRVWKDTEVEVEKRALEKALSSGMAFILHRLDEMRDSWSDAAINHPDIQEMLQDQAEAHIAKKDKALL